LTKTLNGFLCADVPFRNWSLTRTVIWSDISSLRNYESCQIKWSETM